MYLGLDISLSGTGIVLLADNYQLVDTLLITSNHKGVERLFHIENTFMKYIDVFSNIKLCCVEGYAYQERGKVFEIGEVTGLYLLNLFKLGIPFIKAAPSQLKKYATGKGDPTIKKNFILLKVFQNFGQEFSDDNVCDAYVMARIAHDFYNSFIEEKQKIELHKYQTEVLKALYKIYKVEDMSLIK